MAGALRRMEIIVSAEDNATRTLDKIDRKANSVGDGLAQIEGKAARAKRGFMLAGAGAVAAAAGFAKMAQFGSKLDEQFARIQGIGNYTAKEVDKIRQAAVRIGQDTPLGIGQAADAFEELARAGYTTQQAIKASAGVTDLAVAGNLRMAEAVEYTVQGLQTFNLAARNSGAIANTLANVANTTTADVDDLGQAMTYVGSSAQAAGYSFGETAAAIGVLTDAGQKGSKAGTNLENAMRMLIDPTEKAQGAFKKLGLATDDFTDKQGNMKSMVTIAEMLRERFDRMGITGAERMKLLSRMFGVRGARAMNVLINKTDVLRKRMDQVWGAQIRSQIEAQGKSVDSVIKRYEQMADRGASVEELSKRIQRELGVEADAADYLARQLVKTDKGHQQVAEGIKNAAIASDVAAKQMDTVAGQWEEFTGALETVSYQIYRELEPSLKTLLETLANVVDSISKSPGTIRLLAIAFVGLSTAVTGAAIAFGLLYARFKILLVASSMTGTTITTLGTAFSALASGGVATLTGALGTLVTVLTGPVGIALAVVGAAFVAYKYNILGFKDAVDLLIGGLRKIVNWFGEVARASMWLANQLAGPVRAALRVVRGAFMWIIDAIKGVISWYDDLSPLGKLIIGIFVPVLPVLANAKRAMQALGRAVNWVRARWAELEKRFDPMKIARSTARMANQVGKSLRPVIRWFAGFGRRLMIVGRIAGRAFTKFSDSLNADVIVVSKKARKFINGLMRAFNQSARAANKSRRQLVQWGNTQKTQVITAARQGARWLNTKLAPAFRVVGRASREAGRLMNRMWATARRLQTQAIREIIKWIRKLNKTIANITGFNILRRLTKGWNMVRGAVERAKDVVNGFGKALSKIGKGARWLFTGKGGGDKKATVTMKGGKELKSTARNTQQMNAKLRSVANNTAGQKKSLNRSARASEKAANRMNSVNNHVARTNQSVKQNTNQMKGVKNRMNSVNNHVARTNQSVKESKKFTKQAAQNTKQAANATKATQKSSRKTAANVVRLPGLLKKIQKNTYKTHTNTNQLEGLAKRRNKFLKQIINQNKLRNKHLAKIRGLAKRQLVVLRRQSGQLKRIITILRKQSGILRRIAANIKKQTTHLKAISRNTKNMVRTLKAISRNTKSTVSAIKKNTSAVRSLRGAMRAVANRPVRVNVQRPAPGNRFAAGGVVTQPTEALIGEANEDEAVIPLSQFPSILAKTLGKMSPGRPRRRSDDTPTEINITQSPSVEIDASGDADGLSERQIRRELDQAMEEAQEQTLEQLDDILGLNLRPSNAN